MNFALCSDMEGNNQSIVPQVMLYKDSLILEKYEEFIIEMDLHNNVCLFPMCFDENEKIFYDGTIFKNDMSDELYIEVQNKLREL